MKIARLTRSESSGANRAGHNTPSTSRYRWPILAAAVVAVLAIAYCIAVIVPIGRGALLFAITVVVLSSGCRGRVADVCAWRRPRHRRMGCRSDLGLRGEQRRAARAVDVGCARRRAPRRAAGRVRDCGRCGFRAERCPRGAGVHARRRRRHPAAARDGAGDCRTAVRPRRGARRRRPGVPRVFHSGHDLAHGRGRGGEQRRRPAAQSVSPRAAASLLLAAASPSRRPVPDARTQRIARAGAPGELGRARPRVRAVPVRVRAAMGEQSRRRCAGDRWSARVHELRGARAHVGPMGAGRIASIDAPEPEGSEHRRRDAVVLLQPSR